MVQNNVETIVAIATPPGKGGVGVVRVSGPLVPQIIPQILNQTLKPRQAYYASFYSEKSENQNTKDIIDQGIALYFQNPHSFTGEDVLELQGHGGPFVMEALVQRILDLGARLARPGEFSERAYINNKIDLLQAEAVADLINANSKAASKAAMRSLQGDFSRLVDALVRELIHLRMYIEAGIDFPDEEIDLLKEGQVFEKLALLKEQLNTLNIKAENGLKLSRGLKVVIAGKPNAGKSSLLNCLSGIDSAIVTHIPGTTRDLIKEEIIIDGLVIQLVDTAGIRDTENVIEQEGIKRTTQELALADHVIWVMDLSNESDQSEWKTIVPSGVKLTILCNKIDTIGSFPTDSIKNNEHEYSKLYISAKTGEGIPALLEHLKKILSTESTGEGNFLARKRHIEALNLAKVHLETGIQHYHVGNPELLAEELRLSQKALDEITGKFTPDDLLGKIFSEFCIGK